MVTMVYCEYDTRHGASCVESSSELYVHDLMAAEYPTVILDAIV